MKSWGYFRGKLGRKFFKFREILINFSTLLGKNCIFDLTDSNSEIGSAITVTTNMAALQSEDKEFWMELWKKGNTKWHQGTVDSVIEVSNNAKNVCLVLLNESASCKLASYVSG